MYLFTPDFFHLNLLSLHLAARIMDTTMAVPSDCILHKVRVRCVGGEGGGGGSGPGIESYSAENLFCDVRNVTHLRN